MPKKPQHYIIENDALMQEWDYEKNNALNLYPSALGMRSHTKVWWKCSRGHSWCAMISNRSGHNRACPYCAHQLPIPGETDLATLYPELVKEWHPTKNGTLKPYEIMPGTHKKVWWKCDKGHEWQAEV
ncbi:MAG: zinc-ribbon domain-containing protein, partial [Clostridia bacterium]|nr:zinc-ribbon domain-containing protein [Clostridia bacterium]